MATVKRCDGCRRDLSTVRYERGHPLHAVSGARTEYSGKGLSPLPNGEFDWCEECGKIAFAAVRDTNGDRP